jgi:glycosyltransferase involved in cell wall biosynthesis
MSALVDPQMMKGYFRLSQAQMDEEAEVKGRLFHKAAIVQVCTEAEAARHARLFPDIADRFVPVPLFGPHLHSAPESVLQKHCNASPIRLLFVGNDPRRKGLQETALAYMSLPESVRQSTLLTIVSHFDRAFDGSRVVLPDDARITVHCGLPAAEVLELMRRSHVLLNVSHCESYGMTFLEAMSQGTLCIGPDWEVQRELFDGGRAGINVRCDTSLLREVMLRAIEDEEHRLALASAGWRRFNELYAPSVVAEQYADLFRSVAAASR